MQKMTVTKLRSNIYHVLDEIIKSGEPLAVERHGKRILISLEKPHQSKLMKLKKHHTIHGDPDELIHLKAYTWNEDP